MVDLWEYISPATESGNPNGRPVGVTHTPGGQGIFQAQKEAAASRRVFHVKGHFGAECDWEELYADDTYVYRGIDTSRPAKDGGPYLLRDDLNTRLGSKWAKRQMAVGDVFERNPHVISFVMASGNRLKTEGPVKTWLKLAKVHSTWQGVSDVLELWWLTEGPNQATAKEKYFYGKGLGLVGFEGPGLVTHPNHVWAALPPAPGVPVLTRKPIGFALEPVPTSPAFRITNPARFPHSVYSNFGWRDSPGKPGDRDFHGGVDLTPDGPGPYPVHAAAAGTVLYAGLDDTGYGTRVDIDHGGGYVTRYAHMDPLLVTAGALVSDQTQIGVADKKGWATGTHLHFEIRKDGAAIDPVPFLNAASPPPVVTPPVTPEPEPQPNPVPIVTIPLPELSPDPAVREGIATALEWLADVIRAAPGARVE
jgi:hypothetical protein